jgi:hypothetical protein
VTATRSTHAGRDRSRHHHQEEATDVAKDNGLIGKLFASRDAADHEQAARKLDQKATSTRDITDAKDAHKRADDHRAQARKLRGQK